MEGLYLMDDPHMVLGGRLFLPYANLPGRIIGHVNVMLASCPELKPYVPNLSLVDLFFSIHANKTQFALYISPSTRSHLPSRGMLGSGEKEAPELPDRDLPYLGQTECINISDTGFAKSVFSILSFEPGIAIVGPLAEGIYTQEAKAEQAKASRDAASIIMAWSERRMKVMTNTKIFLSHKGVNKPLVQKVDEALRLIGLTTWFDVDDLHAGADLIRSIDSAFASCCAAVFFISENYVDEGVIAREINRAVREEMTRPQEFRVIPLVLTQHGGDDQHVPEALKNLTWKKVTDIEIVPSIVKALPPSVQATIRFGALK